MKANNLHLVFNYDTPMEKKKVANLNQIMGFVS